MGAQDIGDKNKSADWSPAATANRLLGIYLGIGFAWILLSDYAVDVFTGSTSAKHDYLDTIKGLAFVLVTGLVMFKWLLQRELIQREQALEELQFLKILNELSNDPVYVLDPTDDFRLIHVNEAAVRHFGHSREKLLTMRIRDWDSACTRDKADCYWLKLRPERFALFESKHLLADGRVVPVEISANYIRYQGKEYIGGYFRDITDRKKAEKELYEAKERYHLALHGAGLGTWDWNVQTGEVIFNNRWAEMLGYRLDELEANVATWEKLVHPDDLPEVKKRLQNHLQGLSRFYSVEHRLKMKSGEWLWVLDSGSVFERDAEGKALRAVGIHQDIDERKRAQEAVQLSEQLLNGIYNSSLDGLFLVDWETRLIADCNNQAVRMFDAQSKAEIVGQTGYDWQLMPRTPEKLAEIQQRIASGGTWIEELEYKSLQGKNFWGHLAIRKLDIADSQMALVRINDISSLKKMQEQLRQERDFSRWIMDTLPGVFYVLEADGRIRFWNPQLEKITGRAASEINGLICLELLHPDDRAEATKAIGDALRLGEARIDGRLMSKDGQAHPYHFIGRQIELEKRPCILGVGIDISERQAMEERLKHQLQFQKILMNTIPVPIFIKDLQGCFLDCNQAGEEFLGLSREELRGKTVAYFAPPELAELYQEKDRQLLSEGALSAYESKVKNAQGELRDTIFHKAAYLDAEGKMQGILVVILDITELKAITQRLLLQESALDSAANGIVITDSVGKIIWANPAFTTLTGYALEEVTGLTPQLLKSGRQDKDFYAHMWETILSGRVWRGEMVNKRKDGSFYDEEMTITPVKDEAGKITNFIAIKQDVSQRKQLEAQYLRAQRMEGIGLLAGGIAHDLNNVLAPILMSVQLLEMMHPDDETRAILRSLQDSTQRGADIVRQVLTFARGIKGERLLLTPKHLIKDMVRVAKEAFPRNIRITSNVPADLWNVKGDPTQLHQVLLNLAINARDAMPDGGTLSIDARNETVHDLAPEDGIQIADGEYVVLSAKDTGMGIPPELHERIFEPFFTTKALGKGTGLGLSTVVGIVKSHHGYLRIISEPGKGAEFLVYLPAVKDKLAAETNEAKESLPHGHGELILVVDDEPAIQEAAKNILEHQGYQVLTASDGTEGLSMVALNSGKVKVVITDIMMPFMDGVALVRSLRKMAPEIRIIAASGLASGASMTGKVDELARLGVSPIMHKPFTAQALLKNVQHVLHDEPVEPD